MGNTRYAHTCACVHKHTQIHTPFHTFIHIHTSHNTQKLTYMCTGYRLVFLPVKLKGVWRPYAPATSHFLSQGTQCCWVSAVVCKCACVYACACVCMWDEGYVCALCVDALVYICMCRMAALCCST
jgi:hypothetical protein